MIRRHSSALIPALDEQKKVSRLLYCIEQVYPVPDAATGKYYYKTLYDRVDVDEKWFRLTEDQENYFLVRGNEEEGDSNEEIPVRRTRNKNYVTKVFFCVRKLVLVGIQTEMVGGMGSWACGPSVHTRLSSVVLQLGN